MTSSTLLLGGQLVDPPIIGEEAVGLLLDIAELRVHVPGQPSLAQRERPVQKPARRAAS